MIEGVVNSGALPVLEAAISYASQRQKLIAHNIANLSTPEFIQTDVDPAEFQRVLREALQERRGRAGSAGGGQGELADVSDGPVSIGPRGVRLAPQASGGSVAFHDRNNRDLERLMQDLAENGAAFRVAVDLMRSQSEIMKAAIAQRA